MIQVQDLTKSFPDGTIALDHVNFQIEKGEFVAILGPSGSGKSTLFQCLIRLVQPTHGRILIEESDILSLKGSRLNEIRRKIGVIFQQYNLVQRMTATNNVLAGRLPHISTWRAILRRFSTDDVDFALRCLDRVGLGDRAKQRASTLSGGQQQRVAVARTLAQKPHIILADEPVSSLDPNSTIQVMDILKSINQQEGITILCNLHQVELAEQYADRIIGINNGRVVMNEKTKNISRQNIEMIYNG